MGLVAAAIVFRSSLEKIGRRAGGVPFTEGNGAVPALVHGFLERFKRFGSVLGFVALEGAFESLKIFRRVGDGNGVAQRIHSWRSATTGSTRMARCAGM